MCGVDQGGYGHDDHGYDLHDHFYGDLGNDSSSPGGGSAAGRGELKDSGDSSGSAGHAGVAFLAIMALLIASTVAWFGYAYFFPHTWSGRLLIKVILVLDKSFRSEI